MDGIYTIEDVFRQMSEAVPEFAGLTLSRISDLGVQVLKETHARRERRKLERDDHRGVIPTAKRVEVASDAFRRRAIEPRAFGIRLQRRLNECD